MKATKLLITAIVVVSMVATPVLGAGIDLGSDSVQTAETRADWTKKTHQLDWDVAQYEGDNGSMVSAPMEVNSSADNPYSYVPTHVAFEDAGEFPHSKSNESALDADDWSTSGSLITASNAEPAPGVRAISVATDGSMTSSDTATASYSNFSVETDEAKKFLQLGVDVNTLDSGTVVWVKATDANGDVKRAQINGTSGATTNESTIATGTGDGYIYQRQFGKMDTIALGDGTFNDISSVEIIVSGGDADVDVTMLNFDKMSKYQYGTRMVDTDGDDNLESEDIYETTGGQISISSLESLSMPDSAEIKNLVVDSIFTANSSNVEATFEETPDDPVYYGTATYYIPVGLESAYDISYANAETYANQSLASERYVEVSYAEAVGDTDPQNVTSWSSYTDSFSSVGTEVVIDNTKQPGQTSYVKIKLRLTEEGFNAAQQSSSGGAIFGPGGSSGGGLGNLPVIGGVIGALGMVWVRVKGLAPSWVPIVGRT